MAMRYQCDACGATMEASDLESLGDAFIAHVHAVHPDWPYPETTLRNFAEAKQRLSGDTERLDSIGSIDVHPVDRERIADWLAFFDHDAFADNPGWAACYCSEPHVLTPGTTAAEHDARSWRDNRALMIGRLDRGETFGYLVYVDERPAGWVNASMRGQYTLFCQGPGAEPADDRVLGISCFVIAPPYRRHGLAAALLDRAMADAPERGVRWVEGYPFLDPQAGDAAHFRGPRTLYEARGFVEVERRDRYLVMRRSV